MLKCLREKIFLSENLDCYILGTEGRPKLEFGKVSLEMVENPAEYAYMCYLEKFHALSQCLISSIRINRQTNHHASDKR